MIENIGVVIVGGSFIRAGLISREHNIDTLDFSFVNKSQRSREGVINGICKAINQLGMDKLNSIVVGSPGRVNFQSGSVFLPPAFGDKKKNLNFGMNYQKELIYLYL